MKRITLSIVVGFVAVACGGGGQPASSTPPARSTAASSPSSAGQPQLNMKDNFFSPSNLTVASNGKLSVSNDGAGLHNFTLEAGNLDQDVQPGAGHTFTISLAPGTYPFFCKYHQAVGMKGVLTVQ
ncbi:MAG TPA: cupredoxin domain-containing protein [Actinomycetota bacterium]|nr:cupredoxin domain-containing protein [Actinomycetota bacterium]